jgi:riboflavin kinase/FMN adenylyltransferase
MQIHTEAPKPGIIRNPVLTIGIFDGVHRGHRIVLDALKAKAAASDGETVVITLWPHPRMVLSPGENKLSLLSTPAEKMMLLEQAGIDQLVILPFTREFAALEPCDFITSYLVDRIGVNHLVVGFDHHFGRNREGSFERIVQCASQFNFSVEKLEAISTGEGALSSTLIRGMLETGRLDEANQALGYDYSLTGVVQSGIRLGRKLGFPTANIEVPEPWKLIPSPGVYAVELLIDQQRLFGMLNIGFKPTVSNDISKPVLEVHIFDFDRDIYGKNLTLALRKRLRDEFRFDSLEALRNQLVQDENESRELFGLNNF